MSNNNTRDQSQTTSPQRPSKQDIDPYCPFCTIVQTYPPINPLKAIGNPTLDPNKTEERSHVLLSTEHAIAFLDILPLSKGHVLVAPRKHRIKIGDLNSNESAEIGRLLPLLARSIMQAMMPDIPHEEVDYNIVQNNGPGAAQVIPHVHFHIVPRYPFNYTRPTKTKKETNSSSSTSSSSIKKYDPLPLPPKGFKRSAVLFGRGQRHDVDEDDPDEIVEEMRFCIAKNWEGYWKEDGIETGTESKSGGGGGKL